jgi:hypothetical protein
MHYWALECEERMKLWKVDRDVNSAGMMKFANVEEEVDVIQMLHRAYLRTAIEMERTGGWVGSTTVCVALLQRSALHIANVPFLPPNRSILTDDSLEIQGHLLFVGTISFLVLQNNNIGTIVHIKWEQIQQILQ